ncbi:MAG: hypothetical protein P4M13_11160 [Alphaproteobacteria bacterium]|nr:hypothetical protein [Alphaproteobacteria bacterium]
MTSSSAQTATSPFNSSAFEACWTPPIEIQCIISDLDGCITPTYPSLEILECLVELFRGIHNNPNNAGNGYKEKGISDDEIRDDLSEIMKKHTDVKNLLHYPNNTTNVIIAAYAHMHGIKRRLDELVSGFTDKINALIEESFTAFPYAHVALARAAEARTIFIIHTNTDPQSTVRRLVKARVNPDHLTKIWSRTDENVIFPDDYGWDVSPEERPFVDKLVIYTKKKPYPHPILHVREAYGLKKENILMIGDGQGDLGCTLRYPNRGTQPLKLTPDTEYLAYFALHVPGAYTSGATQHINKRLRDHPLGLPGIEERYTHLPAAPHIIMFENGFQTFEELIARGKIFLRPTHTDIDLFDLPQKAMMRRKCSPDLTRELIAACRFQKNSVYDPDTIRSILSKTDEEGRHADVNAITMANPQAARRIYGQSNYHAYTPLMLLAQEPEATDALRALLESPDINPNLINSSGESAFTLAERNADAREAIKNHPQYTGKAERLPFVRLVEGCGVCTQSIPIASPSARPTSFSQNDLPKITM